MKKFVDRFQELETLENEYNSNSSSFVVLYGRRRIGKTELLNEFSRDKKCIRFLATEESEKMNREAFSSIVSEYTSNPLLLCNYKSASDRSKILENLVAWCMKI